MSNVGPIPTAGPACVPAGVANPSHEFDAFHYGLGVTTQNAVQPGPSHTRITATKRATWRSRGLTARASSKPDRPCGPANL